jgi:hypothetical protein
MEQKQHLIEVWVEGDLYEEVEADLQNIFHDNGMKVERVNIKSFPWSDVYHEITWWITRKLNLKEWSALDSAESKAIFKIVGDNFQGISGPIPFDD